MKNILLVTSSPRGEASYSTQIARDLVAKLQIDQSGSSVKVRDLSQAPPPLLNEASTTAFYTPAENRTPAQQDLAEISQEYISELFDADIIVIASGMINFGVPASLKSWIDQVVRSGITFSYGEAGIQGFLKNKKTYLVLASGGVYSGGQMQPMDHQAPYLHAVLNTIGLSDIETILVEGVAYGPDAAELAVKNAREKVAAL